MRMHEIENLKDHVYKKIKERARDQTPITKKYLCFMLGCLQGSLGGKLERKAISPIEFEWLQNNGLI